MVKTAVSPASVPQKSPRLPALDALRGLIIVVMALDHANSLIAHAKLEPELWADQFPNYQGESFLFLTRAVTHLSAPGFFFLMGVGLVLFAFSRREQGWSQWQLVKHFLVRGLLLILLQILVENPAWLLGSIGIGDAPVYFGVLYALGSALIFGALFLYLPRIGVLVLSVTLIILTELLLPDIRTGFVPYSYPMRLWLLPGFTPGIFVLYPVMPWLGVMGLGMGFAHWLKQDAKQLLNLSLWIGIASLLLFGILRFAGGFGNIRAAGAGWIEFLNVVKYPPSVTFLLLTLGINLMLLSLFARYGSYPFTRIGRFFSRLISLLTVFGRVPLFFYVTHLYLYGAMGLLLGSDISLIQIYPYWILGLLILFPLCNWYGNYKHSRPPNSLARFF